MGARSQSWPGPPRYGAPIVPQRLYNQFANGIRRLQDESLEDQAVQGMSDAWGEVAAEDDVKNDLLGVSDEDRGVRDNKRSVDAHSERLQVFQDLGGAQAVVGEAGAHRRGQARDSQVAGRDGGRWGRRLQGKSATSEERSTGAQRKLQTGQLSLPVGLKDVWHMQQYNSGQLPMLTKRSWRDTYNDFYPVNALRNLAWSQVCSILLEGCGLESWRMVCDACSICMN
jgi:hypothetical protein